MINIQALIDSSRELLEQLQNGTHEIISRASPTTWEELRSDLETKLVPILYELYSKIGGLMQPPTIELPDGVTSTSLVSQSEMTQFVTNTLDVWLCDLMERIDKATKQTIYALRPAVATFKLVPRVVNFKAPSATLVSTTIPSFHYDTKSYKTLKVNTTFIEPAKPRISIFKEE